MPPPNLWNIQIVVYRNLPKNEFSTGFSSKLKFTPPEVFFKNGNKLEEETAIYLRYFNKETDTLKTIYRDIISKDLGKDFFAKYLFIYPINQSNKWKKLLEYERDLQQVLPIPDEVTANKDGEVYFQWNLPKK